MKTASETTVQDYHLGFKGLVENLLGSGKNEELEQVILSHLPKITQFILAGNTNSALLTCFDWLCFRSLYVFDKQPDQKRACISHNIEVAKRVTMATYSHQLLAQAYMNQCLLAIQTFDRLLLKDTIVLLQSIMPYIDLHLQEQFNAMLANSIKNFMTECARFESLVCQSSNAEIMPTPTIQEQPTILLFSNQTSARGTTQDDSPNQSLNDLIETFDQYCRLR